MAGASELARFGALRLSAARNRRAAASVTRREVVHDEARAGPNVDHHMIEGGRLRSWHFSEGPRRKKVTGGAKTEKPLLRRSHLRRRLLAHEFLQGLQVGLAGAEERQLVEHENLGREHQLGGVLAARIGLKVAARRAVLVGDQDQ